MTQDEPHNERPVWQLTAQVPAEHTCPGLHAVPHAPQLVLSDRSLTHDCPHCESPVPQLTAQDPVEHTLPAPQLTPHPPQFRLSVCTLTHAAGAPSPLHEV